MYNRSFRSYFHIKWKFLVTSRIFLASSTLFCIFTFCYIFYTDEREETSVEVSLKLFDI